MIRTWREQGRVINLTPIEVEALIGTDDTATRRRAVAKLEATDMVLLVLAEQEVQQ